MFFESNEMLFTVIGKNVKRYRISAGLTQVQLCEKTGISLSYLTKLESEKCNKKISLSYLNLLSNSLNVDITEFFKDND